MINKELIEPKSIAVIGASEKLNKPGGKVIANLIDGGFTMKNPPNPLCQGGTFKRKLYAVNPKPIDIEGAEHYTSIEQMPPVDLAIISIPAKACVEAVRELIKKGTKAFIVFSAGFSEAGDEGEKLNDELVNIIEESNSTLIGPNCIGVINEHYKGVFTTPVPEYSPDGCELISSSGATAIFLLEAAMSTGLRFSNIYSIGNAAQTGVEELLEYMDKNYDEVKSPKVKLLYLEHIKNPFKFLKHASSLIRKGCKIAAIKSGYSEAGGRAASSHTGALATSDKVIRALFKKAGIVYCSGRDELITVGCVFQTKELKGDKLAIITHAGGSAVMLTDALTSGGLKVPSIDESKSKHLLNKLNPGSSVENPIDFLATGTSEQLGEIIDFCAGLDEIDGMIVVFGSPGLFNVKNVYEVLDKKINSTSTPIYSVLPSLINAKSEIEFFLSKGHVNFPDEVSLGKALPHIYHTPKPTFGLTNLEEMHDATIRGIINQSPDGYLEEENKKELLKAAGIKLVKELVCYSKNELEENINSMKFPLVLKVIGPVHKTDVGGVSLNINSKEFLLKEYNRLMEIDGAKAVLVQEMLKGEELFVGAIKQGNFGHLVMCGLGGVFVEVLEDISYGLAPLSREEALKMIRTLRSYKIINGYRSSDGIDENLFAEMVARIASLVHIAPEIEELDINPFKADSKNITAVDSRVKIRK